MINFSYRRVGGMRFLKLGRLCCSWCVTKSYVSLKRVEV